MQPNNNTDETTASGTSDFISTQNTTQLNQSDPTPQSSEEWASILALVVAIILGLCLFCCIVGYVYRNYLENIDARDELVRHDRKNSNAEINGTHLSQNHREASKSRTKTRTKTVTRTWDKTKKKITDLVENSGKQEPKLLPFTTLDDIDLNEGITENEYSEPTIPENGHIVIETSVLNEYD